ncbi:MAG: ROK family transcriptional regulator [Candidatus Marinimicrobia bacterium]|mgnify:FL=1|jgi:predicted NBD/HSP70 family sugar kinase|nr:ROK family transcriptional regulator [Candidatus Neomarinimicrobiota bacterium]MBT3630031.1 ROK family transcriptional regulator [Candidatus Neomarinimicrobiota bacterium]MBT3823856.1 ROK family transcriptional regulator [Candidatus Neomarinimicrobiota bacterium]MBT4130131.1 ROK family transcriptional regulator [Candidatus Neomarinimicrobiota bacterium]MBT4295520.1 ROK family transcriptional regulator [Candidatus Neomarinimicrobiota bacterium]
MKKSNFHFVRQINEISVLRIVRDEGPISRSEVARRMGVSKVIIGGIVRRLIGTNILFEIGKGESTVQGGRRPVMLEFNANAGLAIGIEIHLHRATILVTNMNAEIVHEGVVNFNDNTNPKGILTRIIKSIEKMIGDQEKMNSILGVGIALPGLIDYESGSILTTHSLKEWEGFPIKSFLEKALDTKIYMENDVKAITLGEYHWGAGQHAKNVVYIWLGEGIGAGIIINGDIYRGITASAGEIGYTEFSARGINRGKYPILYQDQRRFGEILTTPHLENSLQKAVNANGRMTSLKDSEINLQSIASAAKNHDPLALDALNEFGEILGVLTIGVINLFNPELIIMGGPVIDKCPMVLEAATRSAKGDVLLAPAEIVEIKAGALKNRAGTLGAVGMVLQDLFKPPIVNLATYRSLILPE